MSQQRLRQTIFTNLTIAGLSKRVAGQISDLLLTWVNASGIEWANSRWKDIRQWYLSYLAGAPVPPQWFSHTRDGLPKPPLSFIFKLPVPSAFLALSVNTLFVADSTSDSQKEKFHHALRGNGYVLTPDKVNRIQDLALESSFKFTKVDRPFKPKERIPTPKIIQGESLFLGNNRKTRIPKDCDDNTKDRLYTRLWKGIPQETLEFLDQRGHLDWLPLESFANDLLAMDGRTEGKTVGLIHSIQEPQLKLRSPANPHKITQHTTYPLGDYWYDTLRMLPTDCTFNTYEGRRWAQEKLRHGVTLASVDMTSASDLLSLDACLLLVNSLFFPKSSEQEDYQDYQQYFIDLSRGNWYHEESGKVLRWHQGQPLGLFPSFALLALTNNALGVLACAQAHIPLDSFRVEGDDFIIDARAEHYYKDLVILLGGEISSEKTITSSKVAEFAGDVITPSIMCRKAIKLANGISDDSFMDYMAALGPKAARLLRTRQRRVYDELKFIPGIAVDGPWCRESFGFPLHLRMEWYESIVDTDESVLETEIIDTEQVLYHVMLSQSLPWDSIEKVPWPIDPSDYQSDVHKVRIGGDPRKRKHPGKSLLQVLEELISNPYYQSFTDYVEKYSSPVEIR
jgi:hypothetical protein